MRRVTSSQIIISVLTQENSIPCKPLTLPLRMAACFYLFCFVIFLISLPKRTTTKKETVCVDVLFFTRAASLAFQVVKCLKELSLYMGYVQLSVVKGQGRKGNQFFSLLLERKLLNVQDSISGGKHFCGPSLYLQQIQWHRVCSIGNMYLFHRE